ncbi:MAG: hypothetical protein O7G85_05720 [Planctomycetota bacterium]|nr:hypothetical protein [Planctomycetota bacterium]
MSENIQSNIDRSSRQALVWIIFGTLSVGILIGFLTGASRSPVVSSVLPLIFAAVGGLGGFHFLRSADSKQQLTRQQAILLGQAATTLVLGSILGLAYGLALRNPDGWSSIFPQNETVELPLEGLDADGSLELLHLRSLMQGVHASRSEQAAILASARSDVERMEGSYFSTLIEMAVELIALLIETGNHLELQEESEDYYMEIRSAYDKASEIEGSLLGLILDDTLTAAGFRLLIQDLIYAVDWYEDLPVATQWVNDTKGFQVQSKYYHRIILCMGDAILDMDTPHWMAKGKLVDTLNNEMNAISQDRGNRGPANVPDDLFDAE